LAIFVAVTILCDALKDATILGKQGRPKKGEEKGTNVPLRGGNPAYGLAGLDRDLRQ
jgi:hypothetical protein